MSDTSEFGRALEAFALRAKTRSRTVFVRTAQLTHESVVTGSPLTAAPGQPVDTGNLRNSWHLNVGEREALITTNVEYAPSIEYNVRGAQLRSAVGGFHSVALTVSGFPRLVDAAVREVRNG